MEMHKNLFKAALKSGTQQLGMWNTIPGLAVPEMLAGAGFDWVLIDTEHTPVDMAEIVTALQAIGQYPNVSALVRPVANDPVVIKRLLDVGAQTLLVPMVDTPEQAAAAVAATRYPPEGVRGMGLTTRAAGFGRVANYVQAAATEICVIVQVESVTALNNLDAIAATPGVDAVFIGPSDLSASMGHPGNPGHPDVQATIDTAFARLHAMGVPTGIISLDPEAAKRYLAAGVGFVAVGIDLAVLRQNIDALRAQF
ncbi:hypothetical protein ACMU_03105 [Actibacterium mucosum KCTC 23349]|uniref:Hydroxypyruvate/pyruvate aldolase n=1 Tax=Actibacterium mucosum KCTC 23349 TaxID=1454373 RepID=A0A037ZN53_9RHOB|nr:HpcH/HpaI aldolase/citrate lyase family protein [Actibacterium mucosum]KAJ57509.1 hypothetical protein ACMU_03105 [Actibacterium mucosum KCTC 23349]